MNEQTHLKAFLVTLFIIAVMGLAQAASAAITLIPDIPGYLPGGGSYPGYTPPASAVSTWEAASQSYLTTAKSAVGGKPFTIPAKLPLASNAAQLAKNAMKLNPYAIAGTLAAGWLLDQGIDYLNDQWQKSNAPANNHEFCPWPPTNAPCYEMGVYVSGSGMEAQCAASSPGASASTAWVGFWMTYCVTPNADWGYVPVLPEDWDALPDPLASVGPELPTAPYMPGGAPVATPGFDSGTVDLGPPYTKPDGSTVQPKGKVTDNGDGSITMDTYDQPLTDPQGNPVPDAPPVDTPEPEKDPCLEHPDRIGCMDAGSDTFPLLQKETHTMVFTPEASPISGGCPASISMPGGHVLSFASACDAMTQIRPIVIALAGVLTAFMVIGVMRS